MFNVKFSKKLSTLLLLSTAYGVAGDQEENNIPARKSEYIIELQDHNNNSPEEIKILNFKAIPEEELFRQAKAGNQDYKDFFFKGIRQGFVNFKWKKQISLYLPEFFDLKNVHTFSSQNLAVLAMALRENKEAQTPEILSALLSKTKENVELKDPIAQTTLAGMYFYGLGIGEDKAQAVHLFEKAAKQHDMVAQYILGAMQFKNHN